MKRQPQALLSSLDFTGVPVGWGAPHPSGLVCGCALGRGLSAAYLAALLIKKCETRLPRILFCSNANEMRLDWLCITFGQGLGPRMAPQTVLKLVQTILHCAINLNE